MPLSKKNYEAMAVILASPHIKSKGQTINALASYLKHDNPRFDRERFVRAIAGSYSAQTGQNQKRKIRYNGRYIVVK